MKTLKPVLEIFARTLLVLVFAFNLTGTSTAQASTPNASNAESKPENDEALSLLMPEKAKSHPTHVQFYSGKLAKGIKLATPLAAEPIVLALSITPDEKIKDLFVLAWTVTNSEEMTLNDFKLILTLPVGFTLETKEGIAFTQENNVITVQSPEITGKLSLKANPIPTEDIFFNAALFDNKNQLLSVVDQILPFKQEVRLTSNGGEIVAEDGAIQVDFAPEVLEDYKKGVEIEIGTPADMEALQTSYSENPFEIIATDNITKEEITTFDEPVEFAIDLEKYGYTDAKSNDVILYWYNPDDGQWYGMASWIDAETNTLHAETDHFTIFDVGSNNWEASKIPSVNSFQVSSFTGASTYSLPIEVPPGPSGLQPSLSLNYNSQIIDQATTYSQAGWVGMGWSLNTGYIELNTHNSNNPAEYSYNLLVNGISTEIIPTTNGWRASDENFMKIAKNGNTSWIIWDKQGNTYEFTHRTTINYSGGFYCDDQGGNSRVELTTRWSLTKIKNNFGQELIYGYRDENKTIKYYTWDYNRKKCILGGSVNSTTATYPSTILYPDNRTRIRFVPGSRPDNNSNYLNDDVHHSFELTRLSGIVIERDADGNASFETIIKEYVLIYSNNIIWPNATNFSALTSVKEYGVGGVSGGVSPLPATTFTYGDSMHLTEANNGYGGKVNFVYEKWYHPTARPSYRSGYPGVRVFEQQAFTIGQVAYVKPGGMYYLGAYKNYLYTDKPLQIWLDSGVNVQSISLGLQNPVGYLSLPVNSTRFVNFIYYNPLEGAPGEYRSVIVDAGYVHALTTIYRVTSKKINDGNGHEYTHSYTYTGTALNSNPPSTSYNEAFSEFRGHASVTEIAPDGTKTINYFHQDDVLKGRIHTTEVYIGNVLRTKTINTYSYTELSGMIVGTKKIPRYWVKLDSTENRLYNNDGTTYNATQTLYTYESSAGMLTSQTEQQKNGTGWISYRVTDTGYVSLNNSSKYMYLPSYINIWNGNKTTLLGQSLYLYDNHNSYTDAPTNGVLTAIRTPIKGTTEYSQITYGYDAWGNQNTQTVYSSSGTASTTPTSGARTSVTAYDPIFHTYPISITTPGTENVPSGLVTQLFYDYDNNGINDYILGVPTKEIDPNGKSTIAQYDAFGRILKVARPGDTLAVPSISISYNDAFPFSTTVIQRIDATQSFSIQKIYDGMGRPTRVISDGTNVDPIYVDTVYQSPTVTKQSMPYAAGETIYYTTTTVTPATNSSETTAPDGNFVSTVIDGLITTVTDANGNSTSTQKDIWGRVNLVTVTPATGPAISYTYDELGRLKTTTRSGSTTTLNYDIGGRKTSMSDPDMGTWLYEYDALGNLIKQTDAKNQVICLYYDSLNRLDGKAYPANNSCGSPNLSVDYIYDQGTNGIGFRTSMTDSSSGSTTAWSYDTRGRLSSETASFTGEQQTFVTSWQYNAADLPFSMIYPDGEILTYSYNSLMQLETVQSSLGSVYYVPSTSYDSAGRLTDRVLGNGLDQSFRYYGWNENASLDGVTTGQGGRLKSIKTHLGQDVLQDLGYLYDKNGNIRVINDLANTETQSFAYDTLNRLTTASATGTAAYSESYTYNATTGNLETKAGLSLYYTDTDHIHAATSMGGNTYAYDANGNMTDRNVNGQNFDLAYDVENRLTSVTQDSQASLPSFSPAAFNSNSAGSYLAMPILQSGDTPTPTSGVIFADGFESGDFSAWDWVDADGGDFSVTAQATGSGSYGAQAVVDDNYELTLHDGSPNNEAQYTARFYFDPNAIQISSNGGFNIFSASTTGTSWVACLYLKQEGDYYSLTLCGKNNTEDWFESDAVLIADEWQSVEIEWKAASASGANNGYIRLYIGDQLATSIENLDNDTHRIDGIAIGIKDTFTASGSMYFDTFDSRAGGHIGLDPNGPLVSPALSRPDMIFSDNFETGSLSEWNPTLTSIDGGDLSVTAPAAYQSTYGLNALIADTVVLKAVDSSPADETRYRARFYFHPNSLNMGNNTSHFIFDGMNTSDNIQTFRLELFYENGTYKLRPRILKDDWGYSNGSKYALSNAWHVIEIDWSTATAPGANNGYLSLWIDGMLAGTISNVDNDSSIQRLNEVRLGATNGLDATTSGAMLFDNFEARRASYIGPVFDPATDTPTPEPAITSTPTIPGPTATPQTYTLTLQPDGTNGADTQLVSTSATSNYATSADMGIGENNNSNNKIARSLIKFDLSALPLNAVITSATLSLWTSSDFSSNDRSIQVYRLKTPFVEGEATWNRSAAGTNWETAGASGVNDREGTSIGSVSILNNEPLNTEKQIVLEPSKIQELINGTFANHGFLLAADTELNDRFDYKTSDTSNATQRPKLVIQYTLMDVTSTPAGPTVTAEPPPVTQTPTTTSTNTPTGPTNTPTVTTTPTQTITNTPTASFTPSITPSVTPTSMPNPGIAGLVAWWSLNEIGGIRTDAFGTNHLSDNNAVGYGNGKHGYGAAFFGATPGKYLSIADNPNLSTGDVDFSISANVYLDSTSQTVILLNKGDKANMAIRDLTLYFDATTSKLAFRVGNGTITSVVLSTETITSGQWYFVTAWHDSVNDTLNIQVNNNIVNSTSYASGAMDTTHPLTIGAFADGTYNFQGILDEVSIYKRVLTAPERTWLYNNNNGRSYAEIGPTITPISPNTTGLISWWSMNEASGPRNDSHNTSHLTDNNTVGSTAGKQGNAASFVPANQEFLSAADLPQLSGGDVNFTLIANVYLNTNTSSFVVLDKSNYPNTTALIDYRLAHNPTTGFRFRAGADGGTQVAYVDSGPVSTRAWHTIIAWHDADNNTINIQVDNGNVISAPYSNGTTDTNSPLTVGAYSNGATGIDGKIDEVAIYKRVLTANERAWLFNNGQGRSYAELDPNFIPSPTPTNPPVPTAPPSGIFSNAQFSYDGDGKRVKSVLTTNLGQTTTYFVGGHYEVTDGVISKYYYAGATRIAMRKNGTLYYLLGDHLGSTSLVTFENGNLLSETRYKAWGEVRYTSGVTPTNYTYTGQYSYTQDFGLMFYNARWYDPALGRFAQADSIVPPGVQGLDRYAYVNNSPMNYVDPTGHISCSHANVADGDCYENRTTNPLVEFAEDSGHEWEEAEKAVLERGVRDVANALAREMNNQCRTFISLGEGCSGLVTGQEAFYEVFGGSITVRRSGSDCDCWAMNQGIVNGHHEIWVYSTTSTQDIITHPLLIVHEIGHAFDVARGIDANSLISNNLLRPINSDGIVGTDAYGGNYGYAGPHYQWQFGRDANNRAGEEYADMFVGWVYNQWEGSALGTQRQEFMNALMISYLP